MKRSIAPVVLAAAVAAAIPALAAAGVAEMATLSGSTTSRVAPAGPAQVNQAIVKVRVIGQGRVTSSPAGLSCTPANTPCEATFPRGTTVTLNATGITGSPGFFWHVWDPTGPCGTQGPTCSFGLNGSFFEVAPTFVGYNAFPPTITGRWRGSTFSGQLSVRGTASHAGALRVTVVSGTRTVATFPLTLAGGDFAQTFTMPRQGFFPGRHTVVFTGHITGHAMPDQQFPLNVAGPPQGVLQAAWVSSIASVRPVRRLPAGSPGAVAHFVFASLPQRGRRIMTTWRRGGRVFARRTKARTKSIISTVVVPGGRLTNGIYSCTLTVGPRPVATVRVRVG